MSTWKPEKDLSLAAFSSSWPILTHVSVTITSALEHASLGSVVKFTDVFCYKEGLALHHQRLLGFFMVNNHRETTDSYLLGKALRNFCDFIVWLIALIYKRKTVSMNTYGKQGVLNIS